VLLGKFSTLPTKQLLIVFVSVRLTVEAEEMNGREKTLGPDHKSTLTTVRNLGSLYKKQSKLKEAEDMYQRALKGYN
jgi:hypothetical protein